MDMSTGGSVGEIRVPNGAPRGFVEHDYSKTFHTPHPIRQVWAWLNDPATFVDGQVWPYRVEFVDGGFEPGVLNVHHGPFLNVAGTIGEVRGPADDDRPAYRDLQYFYGSYALTPRLVRPTRLQFWADENGPSGTTVTLRLDSLVRRPFVRPWDLSQKVFWSRFPRWMDSALGDFSAGPA